MQILASNCIIAHWTCWMTPIFGSSNQQKKKKKIPPCFLFFCFVFVFVFVFFICLICLFGFFIFVFCFVFEPTLNDSLFSMKSYTERPLLSFSGRHWYLTFTCECSPGVRIQKKKKKKKSGHLWGIILWNHLFL